MVDLDTQTDQQLVDRLVHASEEEDLLYVEICLRRLIARGVKDAVTRNHSWKGISALAALASFPHTQLRQLLLEILLFRLCTRAPTAQNVFHDVEVQLWASKLVEGWERYGRFHAPQATAILSLPSEAAVAAWLDSPVNVQHLPPSPHPQDLTGCRPLPPPPSFISMSDPVSCPSTTRQNLNTVISLSTMDGAGRASLATGSPGALAAPTPAAGHAQVGIASPSAVDILGPPPFIASPHFSLPPVSPIPLPTPFVAPRLQCDDHPIRIRVGNLPTDVTEREVGDFFASAGFTISEVRTVLKNGNLEIYGTLPSRAAWSGALERVHGKLHRGRRVYLDRDRPDFRKSAEECAQHPIVIVEGLPQDTMEGDFRATARKTHCGVVPGNVPSKRRHTSLDDREASSQSDLNLFSALLPNDSPAETSRSSRLQDPTFAFSSTPIDNLPPFKATPPPPPYFSSASTSHSQPTVPSSFFSPLAGDPVPAATPNPTQEQLQPHSASKQTAPLDSLAFPSGVRAAGAALVLDGSPAQQSRSWERDEV
ncbi:hypothetical protein JCM11251_006717 [Rhodosporidiobolus azoricus]